MKNLLKMGMALLIIAMVIGFVGCLEPAEEEDSGSTGGKAPDFTNYKASGDYALGFRNGTTSDLVLFASSLTNDNMIGGVMANSTTGASFVSRSKNSKWFNTTQAFEIIAVTKADYDQNSSNPSKIVHPLARLYAFWNHQGTNDMIYDIDGRLGGNTYYLEIIMPQSANTWNAEMRSGGIGGEAIGYAPYAIMETRLYVLPDKNFHVFPVFHRWNSFAQNLEIAYPLDEDGNAEQISFAVGTPGGPSKWTVNMRGMLQGVKNTKPNIGAAYIMVNNGTTVASMLQMVQGMQAVPLENALGVSLFGTGTRAFEIKMDKAMVGGGFGPSKGFNGYKIGVPSNEQDIVVLTDEGEQPSNYVVNLENGKVYTINVTGNTGNSIKPVLNLKTSGLGSPYDFVWEGNN